MRFDECLCLVLWDEMKYGRNTLIYFYLSDSNERIFSTEEKPPTYTGNMSLCWLWLHVYFCLIALWGH